MALVSGSSPLAGVGLRFIIVDDSARFLHAAGVLLEQEGFGPSARRPPRPKLEPTPPTHPPGRPSRRHIRMGASHRREVRTTGTARSNRPDTAVAAGGDAAKGRRGTRSMAWVDDVGTAFLAARQGLSCSRRRPW
jgi:hypothetical protein